MSDVAGGRSDSAAVPASLPARPGTLNLPNSLTVMRLLLVPVFVVVLMHADGELASWRWAAWGVFAVAGVTDFIDGDLARRRGSVTEFGKLIDPIADKALIGASLVCLSALGDLPWWITLVIVARELGVTALRFWVIRHGVMPASKGGKVKTLLQAVGTGLFVLPHPGVFGVFAWLVLSAALVVTLATGIDYVARAVRLRRGAA